MESEIKALISNSQNLDHYNDCDDFETIEKIDPGPADVVHNTFRHPINTDGNATGTVIKDLYVQKCLMNEFYYKSCDLYGDTEETTTILAHSTDTWNLCDIPPPLPDNFFDDQLLEDNQRMAY